MPHPPETDSEPFFTHYFPQHQMDMGYLGCGEDVLHLADSRCSGRQQCQISIPDTEFETTEPCLELKSYLEISTTCLQGEGWIQDTTIF